jgi:hypothetical protein
MIGKYRGLCRFGTDRSRHRVYWQVSRGGKWSPYCRCRKRR